MKEHRSKQKLDNSIFIFQVNKMAWKNIKQRSLADDLVQVHSAVEEPDEVN